MHPTRACTRRLWQLACQDGGSFAGFRVDSLDESVDDQRTDFQRDSQVILNTKVDVYLKVAQLDKKQHPTSYCDTFIRSIVKGNLKWLDLTTPLGL